jgi:predicted nucleotidyltransferase
MLIMLVRCVIAYYPASGNLAARLEKISDPKVTTQAQIFLDKVKQWAETKSDIIGLALVGSYARNEARADSDIDLVLLASQPQNFVNDSEWIKDFGLVKSYEVEDWGLVTSLRVYYEDGLEVEYGFTSSEWVRSPIDEGTRQVISDGMQILLDKEGLLSQALKVTSR